MEASWTRSCARLMRSKIPLGLPEEDGPQGSGSRGRVLRSKRGQPSASLQQTDLLGDGGLGDVELLGAFVKLRVSAAPRNTSADFDS